nr:Chain A, LVHSSN (residues 16-21) from islet amyloid polypeptide [Homo sapiens]
LVHSSN